MITSINHARLVNHLRLLSILLSLSLTPSSRADYSDIVSFFNTLHGSGHAALFPVSGGSLDDFESSFGPRNKAGSGAYDWHRGFDVDGTDMSSPIVAPLDGYFYDYRTTSSGGNIVILEHHISELGGSAMTYNDKSVTKFYTWYLHLWDDDTAANGTSTDDLVSGYSKGDAIARGTQIGVMGQSGSTTNPHLHFEIRIGTNNSLEYQTDNPSSTQWGFDPHLNPMLLFAPNGHGQFLSLSAGTIGSTDLTFDYAISDDDYPVFNSVTALIRNTMTEAEITSHVLDLNQRTGFDATSTNNLDTQDTSLPYIVPSLSPFGTNDWETQFVVPESWLNGKYDQNYELVLTATDIWGTSISTTVALSSVPEPATATAAAGLAALLCTALRRRRAPPTKHV